MADSAPLLEDAEGDSGGRGGRGPQAKASTLWRQWRVHRKVIGFAAAGVVFTLVTVLVVVAQWHALDAGVPPFCSKGGAAAVFANTGASAGHSLLIFSGNAKHGILVDETKRFLFDKSWWRTVFPSRDGSGIQSEFSDDGRPSPRWKSSAVANDSSMVLFGGHALVADASGQGGGWTIDEDPADAGFANDLWVMHHADVGDACEPSWEYVHFGEGESVPSPRRSHAAARVGHTMFVFGGKVCGADGKDCEELGDLWQLDLVKRKWTRIWEGGDSDKGPNSRHGHSAVSTTFSVAGSESKTYFVIYGGRDGDGYFDDVWAWDVEGSSWDDWTPDYTHSTAEFPSRRDHHHAASVDCYADENPKMVVFGGRGDPTSAKKQHGSSRALDDLWEFDMVSRSWKEMKVKGRHKPSARFLAACTQYDAISSVDTNDDGSQSKTRMMVIFGGDRSVDGGQRTDDLWEFNTWSHEWTQFGQNYAC